MTENRRGRSAAVEESAPEVVTAEAQQRAHDAKAEEERKQLKAITKVADQWVEVVNRGSDETGKGKVILRKHVMPSGHTYSEFVGRENNPGVWAWLKGKMNEGTKVFRGPREYGQPYKLAASAPPAKKK